MSAPDFIVAGFMKCGTTSLHGYLTQHPGLDLPKMKETDFFVREHNWSRGLNWYENLFSNDGALLRGEISPNYAKRHCFPGVARRIQEVAGEIPLFFLVRDPIDRAVSHYKHQLAAGDETRTIDQALSPSPDNHYLACSQYAYQLEPYVETFGWGNIHVFDSYDLRTDRDHVLNSMFTILDVDPISVREPENTHRSAQKRRPSWLDRKIPGSSFAARAARSIARPLLPNSATLGETVGNVSLSPEVRAQVEEYLRPTVAALREQTNRLFENWSV